MTKPTDIRLLATKADTQYIKYRAPMKFGGRVVSDVVLLNVHAEVETRDGRRGRGFGSMTMGNVWGWPSQTLSTEQTLAAMVELGKRFAGLSGDCRSYGHPLEITHQLAAELQASADAVTAQAPGTGSYFGPSGTKNVPVPLPPNGTVPFSPCENRDSPQEPMPRLAQLVAASPTEAAIHDAFGKALGQNSYNLLGPEYTNTDLAAYLSPEFRGEYLDRYTLRTPKPTMPLYHLVGALDPLTDADLPSRIDDGLPETLGEWIAADGLTHLKIKLAGDDLAWDVERVLAVERVAAEAQKARGCTQWHYSADFNEKCANVEYVLDFLPPSAIVRRQPSSGSNTSSSPRTATCGRTPRTGCIGPPRSSPW